MKTNIFKIFLAIIFFATLSFNIKFLTSQEKTFNLFGIQIEFKSNDVLAEYEQKYKMSIGPGCICGSNGDYWVSCHLPSSLNECSIMSCQCFEIPY